MRWHTVPPEWAAYVGDIVVIDRGDEVHLSIDMRSKRVPCHAEMGPDGNVLVVFYAAPSMMSEEDREQVVWPEGLGPWPETAHSPYIVIDIGGVERAKDLEVVGQSQGRYAVRVSLVRRVDWQGDDVAQVDGPTDHDPYGAREEAAP